MRCGRILIFLCQALYLVGKIQAQDLDDAVDGATDTVDDTSAAGCDSVDTATDAVGDTVDDADGGSRIPFSMLNGNNIEEILLGDRLSIIELYYYEKSENWTTDLLLPRNYVENQFQACNTNKSVLYKEKLITAIKKVLQFYSSHEDVALKEPGDLIGLSILKGVEDKHGMQFKRAHNVSTWLTGTCSQVTTKRKEFCTKLTKIWKQREGNHWKSKDVINSIRNSSVAAVGHEMEYNVRTLNAHCQHALLTRCQVPHVCERTLYDPTPRAQYYLAKQVLQRIFTEQSDCHDAKRFLSEEVTDQLCSKMYQEAELISEMGYPHILRDLFVEHVAICGFLRYPNFFRQDWIDSILSWQSESAYGCMVNDKGYQQNFWSKDAPIARRSSPEEKEKGLVPDEMCLPHSTMFALAAYSLSWDYMEENCK